MKHNFLANLFVGVTGAATAYKLQDWSHMAAIFAGAATGVWMLTQTALAIIRELRKK